MKIWLVIFSILIVLPIFLLPANKVLPPWTDYDIALPVYDFNIDFIRNYHRLPSWNPYVGLGMPVVAEPLSNILNPFFTLPQLIFGVDLGLKVVFWLCFLFAGLNMFWWLSSLKIAQDFCLLGALLYQVAGALVARMACGHIEYLTYPLMPLFLLFTLNKKMSNKNILFTAMIFILLVFSGDFYNLLYLSIFFLVIRIYYRSFFKEIFFVYAIFFLLSSIKLLPLIFEVYPKMVRFFPINPTDGSIHLFLTPLPFIVPLQATFYDRPFLQKTLGFHFNWTEYFAFISPLPFIFLLKIKKVLKNKKIILLLILLGTGLLYVPLKYPYSPFYWLIKIMPILKTFRVPQRIFLPLTGVMIAILMICANNCKNKLLVKIIMILSIVWCFLITEKTLLRTYVLVDTENQKLISELRKKDGSDFKVVVFKPGLQRFLIKEKIPVLNYMYGFRFKETPNFLNESGEDYNYALLNSVRPKYVLAKPELDLTKYFYTPFLQSTDLIIWMTEKFNMLK